MGFSLWCLVQIHELNQVILWLNSSPQLEPKEKTGAWGILYERLYRDQGRYKKQELRLHAIIARYQNAAKAFPDAVVILDKHNHLVWWNQTANQSLGLSEKFDQGKSIFNFIRDPRFKQHYDLGFKEGDLELPSPVNPFLILEYKHRNMEHGDHLLIARDISRIKRLEITRQSFVANASHELRTPLTVLRGYLETYLDLPLPSHLLKGLQQMQTQTQRMEGLVKDMLTLSRLESAQPVKTEIAINMQHLLQQIFADAQVVSGDKQQQFNLTVDASIDLLGHESELHSAFNNLVTNAIRYTPAGSKIDLTWFKVADGACFQVSDNGPGIETKHLSRLTERFYRVDEGRSKETGGTGLGLSIVKHVMMRHSGRLQISSTLGKGSHFRCHFPKHVLISTSHSLDH